MALPEHLPRFVSPRDVPLPRDYVERHVEQSERRWVAFDSRGVLCESDDAWSLIQWVGEQGLEVWVTLARVNWR